MLKAVAVDKRRILDAIVSFIQNITSVLCKDHYNLECYKPQAAK